MLNNDSVSSRPSPVPGGKAFRVFRFTFHEKAASTKVLKGSKVLNNLWSSAAGCRFPTARRDRSASRVARAASPAGPACGKQDFNIVKIRTCGSFCRPPFGLRPGAWGFLFSCQRTLGCALPWRRRRTDIGPAGAGPWLPPTAIGALALFRGPLALLPWPPCNFSWPPCSFSWPRCPGIWPPCPAGEAGGASYLQQS